MKSYRLTCGRFTTVLGIVVALWLLLSCAPAQPTGSTPAQPAGSTPAPTPNAEEWRKIMPQIPILAPKKGCFNSTYPNTEWHEVPCVTPPPYPMPPRRGARTIIVGNGNHVSPQTPAGFFISTAIGSFDSVTGVTNESSPIANSGSPVADAYTLQINTNTFASTVCAGSPNAACQGWQQFVYANNGTSGTVYIQYWLLSYNTTCPAGWNQFSFTGETDIYCWRNSNNASGVPNQLISNLGNLRLSGTVGADGDSYTFSTGDPTVYAATGDNSVNAVAGWNTAEFDVFGYGGNSNGGGGATFNNGSTVVPRVRIIYGGVDAPTCVAQGFTGETNNLNFGPTAPSASPPGPALLFTESSDGGAISNCAAATTVGDTHLTTFNGLLYDFQASGDFVLAQRDPDFVVQTRQVSGALRWPNASVNSAVATQMGRTKVAICLAEVPLNIDGKTTNLGDGEALSLPDGVDISRRGNVYFIIGQNGDSVRAVVNDGWINVNVGLGQWPTKVHGLLANANGNVKELESSDGKVLEIPFSFKALYSHYTDSWRVPKKESLLSVCGEEKERGIPEKPFYTNDLKELNQEVYSKAREICTAAGVKKEALLDACTLDVAVIGKPEAANVFVDAPVPVDVGLVRLP